MEVKCTTFPISFVMCTLSTITTDYIRKLQENVPQEHAKAQQALKAGNKSEAQLCLTRRKLMENEVMYDILRPSSRFFAPIEFFGRQSVYTNPRPPWKRLASPFSALLCNHWSLRDLGPRGTKQGCLYFDVNLQRYTWSQFLRQLLINWSTEETFSLTSTFINFGCAFFVEGKKILNTT